jgi:hypothetical protein
LGFPVLALTAFVHISLKPFHDVDRIFRAPNAKWNDEVHLGKRQSTGDQKKDRNGTRRNFWGADNAGGGDLRVREILINIGIIGDW